jgi:hypothetical protein
VQWELLDRGELHLVRNQLPQVQATQRATQLAEIPLPSQKQLSPPIEGNYAKRVTDFDLSATKKRLKL